jgi:hypothetical protein
MGTNVQCQAQSARFQVLGWCPQGERGGVWMLVSARPTGGPGVSLEAPGGGLAICRGLVFEGSARRGGSPVLGPRDMGYGVGAALRRRPLCTQVPTGRPRGRLKARGREADGGSGVSLEAPGRGSAICRERVFEGSAKRGEGPVLGPRDSGCGSGRGPRRGRARAGRPRSVSGADRGEEFMRTPAREGRLGQDTPSRNRRRTWRHYDETQHLSSTSFVAAARCGAGRASTTRAVHVVGASRSLRC